MNKELIKNILENMPNAWLELTTHRLDVYNESRAKIEFIEGLEKLTSEAKAGDLTQLPTAYDYIRLGHPLSCILEWSIAKLNKLPNQNVISFSSETMPILAILRKNLLDNIKTQIVFDQALPSNFDEKVLKEIYGYNFTLVKKTSLDKNFEGKTIILTPLEQIDTTYELSDFVIMHDESLGSIVIVNDESYISEIQHVRRRESIAMTPRDCKKLLEQYIGKASNQDKTVDRDNLAKTIKGITSSSSIVSIGSCGLSIQYAIMMGLIHKAKDQYPNKNIKFIVPPNCYGGTNDQARRVAACVENVEILDLPVDGSNDMVNSCESILEKVASLDAIAFIIAEIPTNPRVEVPDLEKLSKVLSKKRITPNGDDAIKPVFILDQTFCPNIKFLDEDHILSDTAIISYVSGSKFPSGGLCTAGYCVSNSRGQNFMKYIDQHLRVCSNQATDYQVQTLIDQMPSMLKRIEEAYLNTRGFVDFIEEVLPEAGINFVSPQLAKEGFTPSVFSLDLPAKNETHKRELNHKLIKMMINEIPNESKHCVSYGQLQGCYWTIPATSTQGTTKEGDKDYIVRVAVSPKFDLNRHKSVFVEFIKGIKI